MGNSDSKSLQSAQQVGLTRFGTGLEKADAEKLWTLYDKDGNGELSKTEAAQLATDLINESVQEMEKTIEFLKAAQKDPAMVQDFLDDLDINKDGVVSKAEFIERAVEGYSFLKDSKAVKRAADKQGWVWSGLNFFPAPRSRPGESVSSPVRALVDTDAGEMIFQLGTNNWQRPMKDGSGKLEFAPGSGVLHEAHHNAYNNLEGVTCYSMYPSQNQAQPTDPGATYRVFELDHPIPICESASPNSSKRWHGFSDQEFDAYVKRLENEVYYYMKECEAKEGKKFTTVIAHHSFVNPLVLRSVVQRRMKEGLPKCQIFCFVHGTALKMYRWELGPKETEEQKSFPMRFHNMMLEQRIFNDTVDGVSACFVISQEQKDGIKEVFPTFPQDRVIVAPNGINVEKFKPQKKTFSEVMVEQTRQILWPASAPSEADCAKYKRMITFVGKFAEWKRQAALLHAMATLQVEFPDLALLCAGTGPDAELDKLKKLCEELNLTSTFLLGARGQDILAEIYTVAELGVFPSFKEPFGLVFVECMACKTPVIGANSGGPKDFVSSDVGMLVDEPPETKDLATVPDGVMTLGATLAKEIATALKENWKKSKGDACYKLANDRFTVEAQVKNMLKDVKALTPLELIFQLGTNNWQRPKKDGSGELEFAPGSGVLHEAHHNAYNNLNGVKCYSMYPSKNQAQPTEPNADYRVFELDHDIPICESASPNSSKRWHGMSDQEFTAYVQRLENEVYDYMKQCEHREATTFKAVIAHHSFINPLVLRNVVQRRMKEGLPKCPIYCFVHGTALKMYRWELGPKETEEQKSFPMRFHTMMNKERIFNDTVNCVDACFVISQEQKDGIKEVFPTFPQERVIVAPNGINVEKFQPQKKGLSEVMVAQTREILWPASAPSEADLAKYKRIITFVGKAAEWKRQAALLHAMATLQGDFPDLALLCVGTGPAGELDKLKKQCEDLKLTSTFLLGARGQDILAELYTVAELGIFPSFKEPFGLVFVECMACKTPVIGANSGGPKDFVTPEVGMLVPEPPETKDLSSVPDGVKTLGSSLVSAITQALNEDWKKTKGEACIKLAHDRFTVAAQCTKMLEDLQKLHAAD